VRGAVGRVLQVFAIALTATAAAQLLARLHKLRKVKAFHHALPFLLLRTHHDNRNFLLQSSSVRRSHISG
jgi:hypothetical protein